MAAEWQLMSVVAALPCLFQLGQGCQHPWVMGWDTELISRNGCSYNILTGVISLPSLTIALVDFEHYSSEDGPMCTEPVI